MYSRMVGLITRRRWRQLNAREVDAIPYAGGARFQFPGDHELAAECSSRAEIERWFGRLFERLPDLRFAVEDVVVSGPPWNLRVCTRYRAHSEAVSWRGAQFARIRWGRITEEVVYPDTQALARGLG